MGSVSSREKARVRFAAWYAINRERVIVKSAVRYAGHLDEKKAYDSVRYAINREHVKVRNKAWYAANSEQGKALSAAWRIANPEKRREYHATERLRRQARLRLCNHLACLALGAVVLAWQTSPHECHMCGAPLWLKVRKDEPGHVHMDHVVPVSRGGLHCAENLLPACASCNLSKGAKLLEEMAA